MPEFLFCVSEERKVQSCTMNAAKDRAKGHEERGVQVLGISVLWNIERRNVCGQQITDSVNEGEGDDWRKEKCNVGQRQSNQYILLPTDKG